MTPREDRKERDEGTSHDKYRDNEVFIAACSQDRTETSLIARDEPFEEWIPVSI